MTDPANKPPQLITTDVITKANLLGMGLLALFTVGAGLIYLLLGLTGWEGGVRILVALLISPVVVSLILGSWWILRRANIDEEKDE